MIKYYGDLLDSLTHHRTGNQKMAVCTLERTEGYLVVAPQSCISQQLQSGIQGFLTSWKAIDPQLTLEYQRS